MRASFLPSRRWRGFHIPAAILFALSTLLVIPGQGAVAAGQTSNLQRAVMTYQAIQQNYYVPSVSLYRAYYPFTGGNPYSYVWPLSQAFAMTNDMAGLPHVGAQYSSDVLARVTGLGHYYSSRGTAPNDNPIIDEAQFPSPPGYDSYVDPPLGGSGDKFYDDNDWIGLDFVQQYLMTGNAVALSNAKEIWTLEMAGWDTNPSHPDPGGIFWTQAPWSQDRNTVSNAPAAELGLQLFLITKDQMYFDEAMRSYNWVNTNMRAPNGLYWDHISLNGTVNKVFWSYNQGTMIGANVLLYRITGHTSYLDQAVQIADDAVAYYGTAGRIWTQDPIFNAIFFRNLLQLSAVTGGQRYRQFIQSYANQAWQLRDPKTGLIVWQPDQPLDVIQQAAMVQIYAMLSWNVKDYQKLT